MKYRFTPCQGGTSKTLWHLKDVRHKRQIMYDIMHVRVKNRENKKEISGYLGLEVGVRGEGCESSRLRFFLR